MSENTKKAQTILIDDVEHDLNEMTQEQQILVQHCMDLERKIASAQFSLDQLNVGKQAFISMLKQSLEKKEETVQ